MPSFLDARRFWRGRSRQAQQAAGRDFPARGRGRSQHRRSAWRARNITRCGPSINIPRKVRDRSRWIFRIASVAVFVSAALAAGASGHRACRGIARSDPFALRRAGFHGIRHARHESHRRWLAESIAAQSLPITAAEDRHFAHRARPVAAANSGGSEAGSRHEQHQRFFRRRTQSESISGRQHVRSNVRPLVRTRAARNGSRNFRRRENAEGRRSRPSTRRLPGADYPQADVSATACASSRN